MSTTHVINSLRRKRAEVSGAIRDLETRIHAMKRDLAHIDATLKLFDPDSEPKTIKPVRPYRPRNRLFEPASPARPDCACNRYCPRTESQNAVINLRNLRTGERL